MAYARKVDSNHGDVMDALRKAGWLVIDTSRMPKLFDLLAYKRGRGVFLIEVKLPKAAYTEAQVRLLEEGWPIVTIRSAEDAINL